MLLHRCNHQCSVFLSNEWTCSVPFTLIHARYHLSNASFSINCIIRNNNRKSEGKKMKCDLWCNDNDDWKTKFTGNGRVSGCQGLAEICIWYSLNVFDTIHLKRHGTHLWLTAKNMTKSNRSNIPVQINGSDLWHRYGRKWVKMLAISISCYCTP